MTIVFAGQVTCSTTPQNLATLFPLVKECSRIVFSAESSAAVRIQVLAAKFSNAIIREINPTAASSAVDEHVVDCGDGGFVYPADWSVASASSTGKINIYGLG